VGLAASCLGSVAYLFSGWLGDRMGARRVACLALAIVALAAWPAYRSVTAEFTAPLVLLGALSGLFVGAYLPLLPPLFPPAVRVSGLAASYDLAAAVVGGTGPFLMLWLDRVGGLPAVAGAMAVFALLGLVGVGLSVRLARHR
jgi:MFS family permease